MIYFLSNRSLLHTSKNATIMCKIAEFQSKLTSSHHEGEQVDAVFPVHLVSRHWRCCCQMCLCNISGVTLWRALLLQVVETCFSPQCSQHTVCRPFLLPASSFLCQFLNPSLLTSLKRVLTHLSGTKKQLLDRKQLLINEPAASSLINVRWMVSQEPQEETLEQHSYEHFVIQHSDFLQHSVYILP